MKPSTLEILQQDLLKENREFPQIRTSLGERYSYGSENQQKLNLILNLGIGMPGIEQIVVFARTKQLQETYELKYIALLPTAQATLSQKPLPEENSQLLRKLRANSKKTSTNIPGYTPQLTARNSTLNFQEVSGTCSYFSRAFRKKVIQDQESQIG